MNNEIADQLPVEDEFYLHGEIHTETITKAYCLSLMPMEQMFALLLCSTARKRFPEEEVAEEFRLPFERGLPIEPEDDRIDLSPIGCVFLCYQTFPWYDLYASQFFMEENVKMTFEFLTARIEYTSQQLNMRQDDLHDMVLTIIRKTKQKFIFYREPIQVPYDLEYGYDQMSLINFVSDWCSLQSHQPIVKDSTKVMGLNQLNNIIYMNRHMSWYHMIFEGNILRILYADQYASEHYSDYERTFKGKKPMVFGEYIVDLLAIWNAREAERLAAAKIGLANEGLKKVRLTREALKRAREEGNLGKYFK